MPSPLSSALTLSDLPFAAQVHPQARAAKRLTWDSREVDEQTAFVALAGEKMHGNQFVAQALERGAPFVLTDQDVPRAVRVPDAWAALQQWAQQQRAKNSMVVGITGSAGKTTAKAYVAAALDAHYMPVFNTMPAIACFLVEHGQSQRPLVVEMGIDRLGEMAELMHLVQPDIGVVTSIGPAHLEQLGSVQAIAREKALILAARQWGLLSMQAAELIAAFEAMPVPSAGPSSGPSTDTNTALPPIQTYGFEGADLSAEQLALSAQGASFVFEGQQVQLPLAARVQAEAAVLGLHLAKRAGLPLPEAVQRVQQASVPAGRYRVHSGPVTLIDDTYNASPLAVKVALDALSTFEGRKISVLGRMLELGPTEQSLHAEVGAYARQKADLTYGVGAYAQELGERAYASVLELTEALLAEVQAGDVVLLKASRGLSYSPAQRAAEGVGLETVVAALAERWPSGASE